MVIVQQGADGLSGHPTIATAGVGKLLLSLGIKRAPPLLDVPLDIAFEIFSRVQPIDLLQLVQTSKALRAHLISRSSAPIWAACRQQVEGLPPCPRHLSEPQYFNLAFDNHCQVCLEPQKKEIIWAFWARHCINCWKNLLTDDDVADEVEGGIVEGTLPQAFHPFYHIHVFEKPRILRYKPHVEKFRILLSSTTSDETRQACIAKTTEQTTKMNNDALMCQQWYQCLAWARFLESTKQRQGQKSRETIVSR